MSTVALQASGLDAGYGRVAVIRGVDLEVRVGEVVALLGPNGAGKTTTVRALAGLLPAMAGEVRLHGRAVRAPLHVRARQGLSLVTERRAVIRSLTVLENLRVARADVIEAFRIFPQLAEHRGRKAGLLSGGQQQMLALARALARRPRVLLVDELSLGLAPMIVGGLLDAVRSAADDGTAVLLVEQHVAKALRIADRASVLRRGRIVLEGPAADFRGHTADIALAYMSPDVEHVDGAEG
jgi:branched-chain amino acid transport system ATP-binding protein